MVNNEAQEKVKAEDLRRVMRKWATGVTIVTSVHGGIRHGMTVSSFTSVSLEPPIVTISLENSSRTRDLVNASRVFAITFLSSEQQEVSERFAGRQSEFTDRFAGLETWTFKTGAPLLNKGLAFLDCQVLAEYVFGANTLFIGKVIAAKLGQEGGPLLYHDRHYHTLQD